jgi:uncharacterized protein (DUF1800 family)
MPLPTEEQPTPSVADASRLLDQATFGVTASDVASVQKLGISGYITAQLAATPSQYTGFSYVPHTAPSSCQYDGTASDAASICVRDKYSNFQVERQFFVHALNDSDQLRQRVAFALSQIFVVSSIEIYEAYGMADYQNMLLKDAFANYRTILQDVTLSPVMGNYLDMVNNAKSNPATGTEPNENYGREVMQLMSLGVYRFLPHLSAQYGRRFGSWGSHQLVIGDAVKGGAIYGSMPELALGGPDDAGDQGRWIPTIAVDQYAATLSTWFGASPSALAAVLPNLSAFTGAPAFL